MFTQVLLEYSLLCLTPEHFKSGAIMDFSKIKYFEKIEKHAHQDFIKNHHHCVLCGSPLELQHIRKDEHQTILEEARCPECDLKTRAKNYTLN